jgi:DnaJ-class molecular chaperone
MSLAEECRMCGGDGRIGNSLGRTTASCPSCHGSGRKADTSTMFRDVTKTKPSHHERHHVEQPAKGPKIPVTAEGTELAREVNASTVIAADAKARLVAEIVNHESTHGRCTETFLKKVRKQVRPAK